MKHRTIIAAAAALAIMASQLLSAGAALAVGSANGGVWKTTDYVSPPSSQTLTAPEGDPTPLLVSAVQKVRCASRYC